MRVSKRSVVGITAVLGTLGLGAGALYWMPPNAEEGAAAATEPDQLPDEAETATPLDPIPFTDGAPAPSESIGDTPQVVRGQPAQFESTEAPLAPPASPYAGQFADPVAPADVVAGSVGDDTGYSQPPTGSLYSESAAQFETEGAAARTLSDESTPYSPGGYAEPSGAVNQPPQYASQLRQDETPYDETQYDNSQYDNTPYERAPFDNTGQYNGGTYDSQPPAPVAGASGGLSDAATDPSFAQNSDFNQPPADASYGSQPTPPPATLAQPQEFSDSGSSYSNPTYQQPLPASAPAQNLASGNFDSGSQLQDSPLSQPNAPAYAPSSGRSVPRAMLEEGLAAPKPGKRILEGVQTPSLSIEKVGPEEVQVGIPATFEVYVRNVGEAVAHQVILSDHVPSGTELLGTKPESERRCCRNAGLAAGGSGPWRREVGDAGSHASHRRRRGECRAGEL